MSEIAKVIPNIAKTKEVGAVFEAFADAIRKHPKEALLVSGVVAGLYMLKNEKFKFKFKDIEFEKQ